MAFQGWAELQWDPLWGIGEVVDAITGVTLWRGKADIGEVEDHVPQGWGIVYCRGGSEGVRITDLQYPQAEVVS